MHTATCCTKQLKGKLLYFQLFFVHNSYSNCLTAYVNSYNIYFLSLTSFKVLVLADKHVNLKFLKCEAITKPPYFDLC